MGLCHTEKADSELVVFGPEGYGFRGTVSYNKCWSHIVSDNFGVNFPLATASLHFKMMMQMFPDSKIASRMLKQSTFVHQLIII